MAKKSIKMYEISVPGNPNFCGVGAGGVQFAHGKAIIPECSLVNWFREHKGYEVKEVAEPDQPKE